MTSPRTSQGSRPPFRRGGRRRRQCFCKENTVDYKDVSSIRRFITDRGRIEAGKKSGNCAKCQRNLTTAIKRARHLALLPYAPHHLRVTGSVASSSRISEDEEDEIAEDGETTEATTDSEEAPTAEAVTDEDSAPEADEGDTEAAEADEDPVAEVEEDAAEADAEDAETDSEVEDVESSETPEDVVEEQPAEADEDDSATEAESEEPSEDVSTNESDSEADPEVEASSDEEDK